MKSKIIFLLLGLTSYLSGSSQETIKAVKIGSLVWTTENLNVSKLRNGAAIPEAKTKEQWEKAGNDGKPMWCYYNFDAANEKKYGKLYNWPAIKDPKGLAPAGWHVSTDAEWESLISSFEKHEHTAKLKYSDGWTNGTNGTNESGFSAVPGGNIMYFGNFTGEGYYAYFWTSTPTSSGTTGWSRQVDSGNTLDISKSSYFHKGCGMSVRCVKD